MSNNTSSNTSTTTAENSPLHVIFGTGPLGRSIMVELVKRGARVRMVNRSGKRNELPESVEVVSGDVTDPSSIRKLIQGAGVVYMCAQPEYTEWVEKFPPLIKSVISGLEGSPAVLVMGDNQYMYGDAVNFSEETPYNPHTRKGKVRLEVSNLLFAAHKEGKIRMTIGRASDFYGPYVLDSLVGDRLYLPAIQGKAAQMAGNLDLPHTVTFINDFGKALVILGEHPANSLGKAWMVPNATTVTQRQYVTMVFEELGLPPKISTMGKLMMSIGGLFIPAAKEVVEMMYEFEKPYIVDSSKFTRTFGMTATPMREAIRETVAWYKKFAKANHPELVLATPATSLK